MDWTAPALVPDNPVLAIAQSRWTTPEARIALLGTGYNYSDGEWHNPSDAFWQMVLQVDSEGLLGAAKGSDSVGISYFPPFTVWFPKGDINDTSDIKNDGSDRSAMLMEWAISDRQVLLFNPRDFDDGVPNMIMVIFKPLSAQVGAPNVCHARQLVAILYTGKTDEAALATCLALHALHQTQ